MNDLFSKWYSEKHKVAITAEGDYFDCNGDPVLMERKVYHGALYYRAIGRKPVSRKQIEEDVLIKEIQILVNPF